MAGLGVSVGVTNEKGEVRVLDGHGAFVAVSGEVGTTVLNYGGFEAANLVSILIGLMRAFPKEAVMMAMMAALGSNDENTTVIDIEGRRGENG